MNPDNPDTLSLDESEWDETQMEDVFVPSVRVQLGWADVEAAVKRGEIVPAAAYALWANWASPGSPTRMRVDTPGGADAPKLPAQAHAEAVHPEMPSTVREPRGIAPVVVVLVALASALAGGVVSTLVLLAGVY